MPADSATATIARHRSPLAARRRARAAGRPVRVVVRLVQQLAGAAVLGDWSPRCPMAGRGFTRPI